MAKLTYSDQISFSGKGYLDAKMQPVATINDLNSIPRAQRFVGLTVTVLDDGSGKPQDYWIENGVKWVKKIVTTENSTLPLEGNDIDIQK